MNPNTNKWLRIFTAIPLGIIALLMLVFVPNAHVTMCMVAAIGYAAGLPVNRYEEKFARIASFFSGGILFYTIYVGTSLLLFEWIILGQGPANAPWLEIAWWYHLIINFSILVLFFTKRDRMTYVLGGMSFFMIIAPVMFVLQTVFGRELWGSENNIILYTSLGLLLLTLTQLLARFTPEYYLKLLPKLRTIIIVSLFVFIVAQLASIPIAIHLRVEPSNTESLTTTIGYVGCSNTSQAVMGYRLADGTAMWRISEDNVHDFDGGAMVDWAKTSDQNNEFWRTFDEYLTANPNTEKIWWQLCVRQKDEPSLEDGLAVVAAIKNRLPQAKIYVSSLPSYVDNVCSITGLAGLARGKLLTEQLAEQSVDVELGPQFSPHEKNELDKDGCHLNETGMRKLGQSLKQFFESS